MDKFVKKFYLFLLAFFSLFTIGFSSWVVNGSTTYDSEASTYTKAKSVDPVCFVFPTSDTSSKTYYTSVKKALDVTSSSSTAETIVIIPKINPTLSSNATLSSEDRLVLCMDESILTLRDATTDDNSNTSYLNYQICSDLNVYGNLTSSTYIKSTLTISQNVTLKIMGTFDIGGAIGGSSKTYSMQRPSSYTNTEATKVVLGNSSKIDVYGTLNCYGFIVQESYNNSSKVILEEGASAIEPFSVYDFGGAGDALYKYNYENTALNIALKVKSYNNAQNGLEATSPFNIWSIHNIASLEIKNGGTLYGDCMISSGSISDSTITISYYCNKITLISSDSNGLISISSSSGNVSILVNPNSKFSFNSSAKCAVKSLPKISINFDECTFSFNSFSLTVNQTLIGSVDVSVKFDASTIMLPISGNLSIFLTNSTGSNDNQGFKFLPESSLTIDSTSVFNINKKSIIYSYYSDSDSSTDYYTFDWDLNNVSSSSSVDFKKIYPYSTTSSASFINNGRLNINADFAGNIQTTESGAVIYIASSVSTSITTYEFSRAGFAKAGTVDAKITEKLRFNNSILGETDKTYAYSNSKYIESNNLKSVSINPSSGSSDAGSSKQYSLSAVLNPDTPDEINDLIYTWSCNPSKNDCGFGSDSSSSSSWTSTATGQKVTFNTAANSTNSDAVVTVTLTVTSSTNSNLKWTATGTYTRTKTCFTGNTLITLSDGSCKMLKDVTLNDEVLSYNQFSGEIEKTKIFALVNHGTIKSNKIELTFDNGNKLDILESHNIYNESKKKYSLIDVNNANSLIGDSFIIYDNGKLSTTKLVSVNITETYEEAYSIFSYSNINVFANGLLTTTPGPTEEMNDTWFNKFEYDEMGKYNTLKLNKDIEIYGLYEYSEWSDLITEDFFDATGFKYFKVAVGKGIITEEKLIENINYYNSLVSNNELIKNS